LAAQNKEDTKDNKRIVVQYDGPYRVYGDIPLVNKEQIVSEYGEPLTWKKGESIKTRGTYELCRCGNSSTKPFCDGSHFEIDFNGTESADTNVTAERQVVYTGTTGIVVKRDYSLCTQSGFCGNRFKEIEQLILETEDTNVRSLVIAMIERCPSGSLVYSIKTDEADIEPDLPQQIAVTTEITSDGSIAAPLWVTGSIPIERADGKPFESRNRVTLCHCGKSKIKPLCDGAHRAGH
jgi:CDGSH-type Zn-finger protein